MTKKAQYFSLGASADKSGLHQALKRAGLDSTAETFAQLNSDLSGDPNYYSFLHCDGAGTKTIVAYLLYRETGDVSVFSSLAQDALVMNLDDILCLGIPERLLLANTIQRNAKLIPDSAIEAILNGYKELSSMLSKFHIDLELAGGETADCGDVVRTLVVDATISGRIKKASVIRQTQIVPGDIIIGFSNIGQSSYEKSSNSSIGSNGLTLARHVLLSQELSNKYPEVLDPALKTERYYSGPFSVTSTCPDLSMSIGQALLSPTRTYAPLLVRIYRELGRNVHGAIHCTGGGQTKVARFGQNNRYVKDNLFPPPPLFSLIQKYGQVSWKEMYQVFNMGHRFELYVPAQYLKLIQDIASAFQIEARQIGHVEKNTAPGNSVVIASPGGILEYFV